MAGGENQLSLGGSNAARQKDKGIERGNGGSLLLI
jgi:hypothetical protein